MDVGIKLAVIVSGPKGREIQVLYNMITRVQLSTPQPGL